jgi:chromosome segregation ATPase
MTNVIDFKTPAQLRDELAAKEAECSHLRSQLASVNGVSEMLTLQILDLKEQVSKNILQMEAIQTNLDRLLGKLPPVTK